VLRSRDEIVGVFVRFRALPTQQFATQRIIYLLVLCNCSRELFK
jgi:hypothetical protein